MFIDLNIIKYKQKKKITDNLTTQIITLNFDVYFYKERLNKTKTSPLCLQFKLENSPGILIRAGDFAQWPLGFQLNLLFQDIILKKKFPLKDKFDF